jgi:hypothetical protein
VKIDPSQRDPVLKWATPKDVSQEWAESCSPFLSKTLAAVMVFLEASMMKVGKVESVAHRMQSAAYWQIWTSIQTCFACRKIEYQFISTQIDRQGIVCINHSPLYITTQSISIHAA